MEVKKCSKCGEAKPLGEFNKDRRSPDGHQDRCRACFSRYNRARYASDPQRFKEAVRKYQDENLENLFVTRMEMCERNPSRKNANMAVDYALKLGYIEKPDHCLGCGRKSDEARITAHHNDYSKPLEVVWVCPRCHRHLDANRRMAEGKSPYGRARGVTMLVGGKPACRFDTIKAAAKAVGKSPSGISACLRDPDRTCAGFGWRYVEDGA